MFNTNNISVSVGDRDSAFKTEGSNMGKLWLKKSGHLAEYELA